MNKLYIEFIKYGKVKLKHACLMCENFYEWNVLSMDGQKSYRFNLKYLNLYLKDEQKSYRFATI